MNESIGERLRLFLDKNGISVADAEKATGIHRNTMYKFFKEKGGINSTTLAKFLNAYPELNIKWLITGQGEGYNIAENSHTVNEEDSYSYDNDKVLEMKIRAILSNQVVIKAFKKIIEDYEG